MNLDELISKYLDGELSDGEDRHLRELISEDDIAKSKFDSAMNLHVAFRQDAETINPPKELIENTEDMILMRIFGEAPETRRRRPILWFSRQMMAAVLAFFMFIFVFEISDINVENLMTETANIIEESNIGISEKNIQNVIPAANEIENDEVEQNSDNEIVESNLTAVVASNETDTFDKDNIDSDFATVESPNAPIAKMNEMIAETNELPILPLSQMATNDLIEEKKNSKSKKSLAFAENYEKLKETTTHSASLVGSYDSEEIYSATDDVKRIEYLSEENYSYSDDIHISSFFGTDVIRTGIDATNTVISHFSESVAYSFDETQRFGVELGYTEYAYNEEAEVNIKKEFGISSNSGIEDSEGGYNFSITSPEIIVLKNNKQMLWATAFYENTLLNSRDMALVGRVGVGSSGDGPLGYGRIFVQYNLFYGFDLTLGAEGRLFTAETSRFISENNNLKSTATIIYGFQFKF